MKANIDTLFLREHKVEYKDLKALVQKKHQIRINFSNQPAYQTLNLDHDSSSNLHSQNNQTDNNHPNHQQTFKPSSPSKQQKIRVKRTSSVDHKNNLIEIIPGQRGRIASLGCIFDRCARRASNMSRTFRPRKIKVNHNLSTIDENFHRQMIENSGTMSKDFSMTINTLQKNGFTNKYILKSDLKSVKLTGCNIEIEKYSISSIKNNRIKRFQSILPKTASNSIISFRNIELKKNQKFQSHQFNLYPRQGSPKSNKRLDDPEKITISNKSQVFQQHPFIKQIKPYFCSDRKKPIQRKAYSEFLRSRPRVNSIGPLKVEQGCRPWSVIRMEQKIDETQQQKAILLQIPQ